MTSVNGSFWLDNPSVLVDQNKISDFFPLASEPLPNRLNASVRLSFYTSLLLSVYHKSYNYFYILLATLFVTWIIYNNTSTREQMQNEKVEPTYDNPVMNFTMGDFLNLDKDGNIIPKAPISNTMDPKVQEKIESTFQQGTYREVSDLFNKNSSQREFYTMPTTDVINDIGEFQNWLYKTPPTCKETSMCLRYEDIRQNAPIFPYENDNPSRISK